MKEVEALDLDGLIQVKNRPCVSMYLPTISAGKEAMQSAIRLKNALSQAEQELADWGLGPPQIEELLAQAWSLQRDRSFWQRQDRGLVLLLSPNRSEVVRLPIPVRQLLVVADRFHLGPLIGLLSQGTAFSILTLNQNEVRLFEASQHHIQPVRLDDMPQGLEEALAFDDPESQLQFHTSTGSPSGQRPAQFHGHGVGVDDHRHEILRYCQLVDRAVFKHLAQSSPPLLLAGPGQLLSVYRRASSYAGLLEAEIDRDVSDLEPKALLEAAWEAVEPYFTLEIEQAKQRYGSLSQRDRTTDELADLVQASLEGRVETLFLRDGEHAWGAPEHPHAVHAERQRGDLDLLDLCAVATWRSSGTLYLVEGEEMPVDAPAAAILRY